jgi:hypothetical protein
VRGQAADAVRAGIQAAVKGLARLDPARLDPVPLDPAPLDLARPDLEQVDPAVWAARAACPALQAVAGRRARCPDNRRALPALNRQPATS